MARIFVYDGREHPDPDPSMSVDDVRKSMSDFFGELANATVKESKRGEDTIYEFTRRVGTKGASNDDIIDVLRSVPETHIKLFDVALERATPDGGMESGQFDETDDWLSAVDQAREIIRQNSLLVQVMVRVCSSNRLP